MILAHLAFIKRLFRTRYAKTGVVATVVPDPGAAMKNPGLESVATPSSAPQGVPVAFNGIRIFPGLVCIFNEFIAGPLPDIAAHII
jgi:hypothetical protein